MKQTRSSIAQLSRQGIGWSSQPTENCHPPFRSVLLPIYPVRTEYSPPPCGEGGVGVSESVPRGYPPPRALRASFARLAPAGGEGEERRLASKLNRKSDDPSPPRHLLRERIDQIRRRRRYRHRRSLRAIRQGLSDAARGDRRRRA